MFWSEYPWWKHLFSTQPFEAYPFELPAPQELPSGMTCQRLSLKTKKDTVTPVLLEEICTFLATHFAARPRLCFTPNMLLTGEDQLWVVRKEHIIGTIRYHTIGTLWTSSQPTDETISLVDAFCIHPAYRKKGIATYLLTVLHRTANEQGRPSAMFLKEGPTLPLLSFPLYSGFYVYRRISSPVRPSPVTSLFPGVLTLTAKQAHRWIQTYMTCQPNTLLIYRPDAPDACWRAYRQGSHSILACIQDTHQQMESGQRIGWVTIWLESPMVTPVIRRQASLAISESVSGYEWLWMNGHWAGYTGEVCSPWKADGGFHWYTYQFTTRLSMERGFGLMC